MIKPTQDKSIPVALFGALGLTAIVIQADLLGHWFGFARLLRESNRSQTRGCSSSSATLRQLSHARSFRLQANGGYAT